MTRFEARLRLHDERELVLIGDVGARSLEIYESQAGDRKPLGRLTLAHPSELSGLFAALARLEPAPPSSPEPMQPFQPPPDDG